MTKNIPLDEDTLTDIRDVVFGPCTVIGESMTIPELLADIQDWFRCVKKVDWDGWFKLRMDIEESDIDPESPFDRTDAEIAKLRSRREVMRQAVTGRWLEFLQKI